MTEGMRVFVVRPFGTRDGIDFETVHAKLIQPAFDHFDIRGGTTGEILESGNIREDIFQQLLVADLVVADVSIHNANVFYELGIRHALQPKRTFLLRAKPTKPRGERTPEDEVPFDLQTDRYLEYDPQKPEGILRQFQEALAQTLTSDRQDSPVFRLLPDLAAQDRSRFLPVPLKFREEVEAAAKVGTLGKLALLGLEAREFPWAAEGLRVVGREQFKCKAYTAARTTWEAVGELYPLDVEANLLLGTIYQRLKDLTASDLALQRVLANTPASPADRAEAYSLIARNIKERWRAPWAELVPDQRPRQASRSASLLEAYRKYEQGFQQDLNSFYPGLNALSLLTLALELARSQPGLWSGRFRSDTDAQRELDSLEQQRGKLLGAIATSLEAAKKRLEKAGAEDRWVDIGLADFCFLTCERPTQVGYAYERALTGAPKFYIDSAQAQIRLFEQLGVFPERVKAALDSFPAAPAETAPAAPGRVILFTGHMIDAPNRTRPRFPPDCEGKARDAIREALRQERERTPGALLGVSSAANGGDILFLEVCAELAIATRVFLPLPVDRFRSESVAPAGSDWVQRFDTLMASFASIPFLSPSDELPPWLSTRPNYNSWQRANLWLLQEAVAVGAMHLTLLALWDGTMGDGPGGTEHMIRLAKASGAATTVLNTVGLFADSFADSAAIP